ncbi:uncharacterized protein LOC135378325 isoform X1 [Ornithodoros turicata]
MFQKTTRPLLPSPSRNIMPMVSLNCRYCVTIPGFLKLIQMALSAACVQVMLMYCRPSYTYHSWGFLGRGEETVFVLVNFSALVMNAILFTACLLSVPTATAVSKTLVDFMGNLTHFFGCIGSSLALLSSMLVQQTATSYKEYAFEGKVTVSVLGIVNSLLYLCSGLGAYWTCKSHRF